MKIQSDVTPGNTRLDINEVLTTGTLNALTATGVK